MTTYLDTALDALRAHDSHPAAIEAFRRRLEQLSKPESAAVPSSDLHEVGALPTLDELPEPADADARAALDRLAVLKLNGGLGTSMGLAGAKSLLEIKRGTSFLDAIATQTLALRERHGARLPLVLMDSAGTREDSLAALRRHAGLDDQDVPLDFLQNAEPKLRADDWHPVSWPADPRLEWCPPGHGDLYTALASSGMLARLLEAGVRWCFVSNSDNLGAVPDVRIAAWMAAQGVPFAMEVARRTPADRKGGHLARRGGDLFLRETAQVPEGDDGFTDIERFCYFNTNNLWFDLEHLRDLQADDPAAPYLPLIVNRKTVDPTDPSSTPVLQLETAMGAAIGSISGAQALEVPRDRFAPVKTTSDLLIARSDLYALGADGRMVPTWSGDAPAVTLDRARFGMIDDFERRFPGGAPSLRRARSLRVDGDVAFGSGVVVEGDVTLTGPLHVGDDEVLRG